MTFCLSDNKNICSSAQQKELIHYYGAPISCGSVYMVCTHEYSLFSRHTRLILEVQIGVRSRAPSSPDLPGYDRPTRRGRAGTSSRYAEWPRTRPHLATAAARPASSICSSTRTKASASHGSASGPAAAYPNASSASSSSARNSGWFTHSVRTTKRCRPAPTRTAKHPSGAGGLLLRRAPRHRPSVFVMSPGFLPFSVAMAMAVPVPVTVSFFSSMGTSKTALGHVAKLEQNVKSSLVWSRLKNEKVRDVR